MPAVQKIACSNGAGFVMSFLVATSEGLNTPGTGNYPIGQTEVIDLSTFNIAEGTEIWPVVAAVLGNTVAAGQHCTYAANDQTATYAVAGTTLDYSIALVGGE